MKFFIPIVLIGLLACNKTTEQDATLQEVKVAQEETSTNILQEQVTAWVQARPGNLDGYQPIDYIIIDTVTHKQEYQWIYKQSELIKDNKNIAIMKDMLDSLAVSAYPNSIAYIRYRHDCQLNNRDGVQEKAQLLVEADLLNKVKHIEVLKPGQQLTSFQ